ncbi:hypothetical protein [Microcoleus sp. bin38.metabat.b11b12b14.051]|uniref:hypothetical protein n=1 Tax=Microcoleus sp. bin38.metabat.b11b12b14.051 TaxID=2742709 RepID=UPI0025F83F3E|nr:hypothetical protein [Microcoleus sp. bin38.metabat.b11b12b14.051]
MPNISSPNQNYRRNPVSWPLHNLQKPGFLPNISSPNQNYRRNPVSWDVDNLQKPGFFPDTRHATKIIAETRFLGLWIISRNRVSSQILVTQPKLSQKPGFLGCGMNAEFI